MDRWYNHRKKRKIYYHLVDFQSIGKVLQSSVIDVIFLENKCSNSLHKDFENKKVTR